MSDDIEMVSRIAECSLETAASALSIHGNVVDAVAALLPDNPVVSGAKYIPAKPKINTGMDAEQTALCERGRWLQDKVNAVLSVAHSKTLPDQSAPQASPPPVSAEAVTLPVVAEGSESSPDSHAQTALPAPQSEPPQ
jgi:hypothetical protein